MKIKKKESKLTKKQRKMITISLFLVALTLLIIEGIMVFQFDWTYQYKGNFFESKPFEMPKLKVVDQTSDARPVAVMINNHPKAVPNHAGLQDAYLVYEMIVEGGLTRMMAVFKDKSPERIGSVRSSRHYFLDYALENDAIYTHFGWSERARTDISSLKINNVNGLYDNGFIRDKSLNVAYEHTAFISMENVKKVAQYRNYRMTSNQDLLLNYKLLPIDMTKYENAIPANNVEITYSHIQKTSYVYDPVNKVYKRYINGVEHKDGVTKEQYSAKNIITYQISNYSFDSYGRQDLKNLGSGTGYYISNGYAIPIKWEKTSRSSQTVYYYENGEELNVNDGNTYIQIQPKGQKLQIEA